MYEFIKEKESFFKRLSIFINQKVIITLDKKKILGVILKYLEKEEVMLVKTVTNEYIKISYLFFPKRIETIKNYVIWDIEHLLGKKLIEISYKLQKSNNIIKWNNGTEIIGEVIQKEYGSTEEEEPPYYEGEDIEYEEYDYVILKVIKIINLNHNFYDKEPIPYRKFQFINNNLYMVYNNHTIKYNNEIWFSHHNPPKKIILENGNIFWDIEKELMNIKNKHLEIAKIFNQKSNINQNK